MTCFFDLEATSPDPATARVTQLAFLDEHGAPLLVSLVNPGRPIPADVQALNGITDEAVKDAPHFRDLADRVARLCDGAALVGFGCLRFDVVLLARELEALGMEFAPRLVIDAGNLFKLDAPRTLTAATLHYLGAGLPEAHRADADADATRRVFLAQRGRMPQLAGLTDEQVADLSNYGRRMADAAGKLAWINGVLCFAFGQHKDRPVAEHRGYAEWMLSRDFPLSTQRALQRELDRLDEAEREPEAAGLFDGNTF